MPGRPDLEQRSLACDQRTPGRAARRARRRTRVAAPFARAAPWPRGIREHARIWAHCGVLPSPAVRTSQRRTQGLQWHLTSPSSGRAPASFACLRPPLMSNVRSHRSPSVRRRAMHRFLFVVLASLLLAGSMSSAHSQDNRASLVRQIVVAQGLLELFDQQMVQQREATRSYATRMFQDGVREAGGQSNPKEIAAFERLVSRANSVFTAQEFVDAWSAEYGKELSTSELTEILHYYESPTGRKDVAASKAAMVRFSQWAAQQGQARSASLISDFAAELKAARE